MSEDTQFRIEVLVAAGLFAMLAVAGATLGGYGVHDFARARASLDWPQAEAVALSGSNERAPMRYAYSIKGRTFDSTRAQFFIAGPGADETQARPGDPIDVFIDPRNPSVSVLRPGGSGSFFALVLAAAGTLVFIGLGGLIRIVSATAAFEFNDEKSEPEGATAYK